MDGGDFLLASGTATTWFLGLGPNSLGLGVGLSGWAFLVSLC